LVSITHAAVALHRFPEQAAAVHNGDAEAVRRNAWDCSAGRCRRAASSCESRVRRPAAGAIRLRGL